MKKIKILGVAPYDGLRLLMEQVSLSFDNIEFTAVNGNLEEGSSIAQSMEKEYDIIISRANTADLISKNTALPVVDIGTSHYDILRCIKQAEAAKTPFSIIGHKALTATASSLCELMEYQIDIISIDSSNNVAEVLESLRSKGITTIICDMVPYPLAKPIGLTPILLTSGEETVRAAFSNAVGLYEKNIAQLNRLHLFQNIIAAAKAFTFVMDEHCEVSYMVNTLPDTHFLISHIRERLAKITDRESSFFITVKGRMYAVNCSWIQETEKPYYIFRIEESDLPVTFSRYGISVFDKEQAEDSFMESFYSTVYGYKEIQQNTDLYNTSNNPVMILGEPGTGKDRVAHLLYATSRQSNHPLYVVDCSLINEKSWNYLTSNCNSPLMDNDNTIYISNLNALDGEKQKFLLSIFPDTNLHVRNRIILSFSCSYDEKAPHMVMRFMNMINCYLIQMEPVRQIIDNLDSSANLYLDILNQQTGKQITSFLPDSIQLLKSYTWPLNITQFKRVLKESIVLTTGLHVLPETIKMLLEKEQRIVSGIQKDASLNTGSFSPNLEQPLHEINREIIMYTLDRHNGNQSTAARQLGISRTTLWRYLNSV